MTLKKHITKSCCGASSIIYECDKPVRKYQIEVFKEAGYLVPDSYLQLGVFYASKGGLTATASFGSPKIQVRTSAQINDSNLKQFEEILERAINLKINE